ncbi:MAG: chemotaxis family two-component system sensor kinase Cph1 [Burkholderiaceae bacterium]|jgi:chemotaxis family two-component system sensor kinase Cph1
MVKLMSEHQTTPGSTISRLSNPDCESEQLHASGAIQPFGALLQFDAVTRRIGHASANLDAFIGVPGQALLGCAIDELDWLRGIDVSAASVRAGKRLTIANIADVSRGRVDAVCIYGRGVVTVEIEPTHVAAVTTQDQHFMLSLMTAPPNEAGLAPYQHVLATAVAAVSGFERVMIYQFMEDWSGEVVTQVNAAPMEDYLGMRFPATDIPLIARNLYLINPCRMIPDIAAVVVPVLGCSATPPDLTWSDLRSVSQAHLDYLTEMGVGASLSFPIQLFGKLWGLVVCHHLTPRLLRVDQRNRCIALVNQLAFGMRAYHSARRLQLADSLNWRLNGILSALSGCPKLSDAIPANEKELLSLMSAQGMALLTDNEFVSVGTGMTMPELIALDDWFLGSVTETVFTTRQRSMEIPLPSEAPTPVCGVMAIKLLSSRSGWLRFYWFRPAEASQVNWAGNPDKPVAEAGMSTPSPKRSFQLWSETRVDCSQPWNAEEKLVALRFRSLALRMM